MATFRHPTIPTLFAIVPHHSQLSSTHHHLASREQVQWQLQNENDFTINKLNARAGQMKGTAGYWMAEKSKANCWVLNGVVEEESLPHIFLTTSEPELHDPVLHRLLNAISLDPTGELSAPTDLDQRKLRVRDNLHVVTEFFTNKMRQLHHHLLYPMLGVESHAARTEFAHRRSMAHACTSCFASSARICQQVLRIHRRHSRVTVRAIDTPNSPSTPPTTSRSPTRPVDTLV